MNMLLRKLVLTNFCIHRRFEMTFQAGLNVIRGPNGSGKSTAINLGLFGGLTNQFGRHAMGRKGCIREDAKSALVEVFLADAENTAVRRWIHPGSNKSELIYGGGDDETVLSLDQEIQAYLSSVFGLEKSVLERFVFIEQGMTAAFLGDTEAEWAKTVSFLCRTQYIEELWKLVGTTITSKQSSLKAVEELDVNFLKSGLETAQQELLPLEQSVADNEQKLAKIPLKEHCDLAVKASREDELLDVDIRANEEHLKQYSDSVRNHEECIKNGEKEQQEVDRLLNNYIDSPDFRADETVIETFNGREAKLKELAGLEASLTGLQRQLQDLQPALQCPYTEQDKILRAQESSQLQTRYAELSLQMKVLADAEARGNSKPCPTCGALPEHQRIPDPVKTKAEYAEVAQNLRQTQELAVVIEQALRHYQTACSSRDTLTALAADKQRQIAVKRSELGVGVSQELYDAACGRRSQYDSLSKRKAAILTQLKEWTRYKSELEVSVKRVTQSIAESRAKLAGRELRKSRADKAQQANDYRASIETQLYGDKLRVADKKSQIAELQRLVGQAENARKVIPMRDWIAVLERTRAVIHRNCIPRLVHHTFLSKLLQGINDMLERFQAPFRVSLNDDLSFMALLAYGCTVPAKALSGGQKVLLATAFWLTLHEAFASKIGLLVLDEPTDGLDLDNRKRTVEIFGAVDAYLRSTNRQMLLITHDELLESVSAGVTTLTI